MILLAVATAVQLVVLLALAVVVLSLARQVGILHERLSPAGLSRTGKGIEPGELLPAMPLQALSGGTLALAPPEPPVPTALFFLSADCPICRSVLPGFATALVDAAGTLEGYWVADGLPGSDGQMPDYEAYAASQGLDPDRFLISQELGLTLGVRQLPALVLVDGEGRLLARETLTGPRQLARLLDRHHPQAASPAGENST